MNSVDSVIRDLRKNVDHIFYTRDDEITFVFDNPYIVWESVWEEVWDKIHGFNR